jgi:multiple antibiotic resistance protein
MEFLKTFMFLAAVIDPLGSIPVFLEATKQFDDAARRKIALRATMFAGLILIFFIAIGQIIMEAMEISLYAFQISGGVILFLFSLTMVFGQGKPHDEKQLITNYEHVTIFPIAMPSIASPGAIMAVVLLTDNYTYTIGQQLVTTFIIVLVLLLTCGVLLAAQKIQGRIGETGITVISKIMGLILASFAIQNVLTGIKEYFQIG